MIKSNLKDPPKTLHIDMKNFCCTRCLTAYPEFIYCNIPTYKASDGLCPNCFKRSLAQRDLTDSEIQALAEEGLTFCKREPGCSIETYFDTSLNAEQLKQVAIRIKQLLEEEKIEAKKQIKEEYRKKAIEVCKDFDIDPNDEQTLLITAAILRYVDEKNNNPWNQRL